MINVSFSSLWMKHTLLYYSWILERMTKFIDETLSVNSFVRKIPFKKGSAYLYLRLIPAYRTQFKESFPPSDHPAIPVGKLCRVSL